MSNKNPVARLPLKNPINKFSPLLVVVEHPFVEPPLPYPPLTLQKDNKHGNKQPTLDPPIGTTLIEGGVNTTSPSAYARSSPSYQDTEFIKGTQIDSLAQLEVMDKEWKALATKDSIEFGMTQIEEEALLSNFTKARIKRKIKKQ